MVKEETGFLTAKAQPRGEVLFWEGYIYYWFVANAQIFIALCAVCLLFFSGRLLSCRPTHHSAHCLQAQLANI